MSNIITLTSDFGNRDWYVGVLKGVLLKICPGVEIVDISHEIAPHDIMEAANVLKEILPHYPKGTIHVCIVDPEVGTDRRAIAIETDDYTLIGPDNGIFSLARESSTDTQKIYKLDKPEFWLNSKPHMTFHGRDIFCPAAAHLASGKKLEQLGTPIDDIQDLRWVQSITDKAGIQGWIVHVDHFGNCITNISRSEFEAYSRNFVDESNMPKIKSYVGSAIIDGIQETYASVPVGEILLLFGSSDYLEVSVNSDKASTLFSIKRGDPINILFS